MNRRHFAKLTLGVGSAIALPVTRGAIMRAQAPAPVPYYGTFRAVNPEAVRPSGWLRDVLQRQIDGLAKNYPVMDYPFNTNLWSGTIPPRASDRAGWWPYEQTGYLVDGLERLGLVTGDASIHNLARPSLDYLISHPQADGTLGPPGISGMSWPHAVVFRALHAEYLATGNRAIIDALQRHYLGRPGDYGHAREVANVEHILEVYEATGDARMLNMAKHTYDVFNADNPKTSLAHLADASHITEHGVTFNETAKVPALMYLYTGDQKMLTAAVNGYRKVDQFDMLPDGLHSSMESLSGNDIHRYHEACNITDYTWSLGYLLMASGDASWADHIERCIFNAGMSAISKDFKSHQYFSTLNQVKATKNITTKVAADRVAYRPGHDTKCCSGNIHRFLPNYAARQWMTARDGGIVAALYGPSVLTTTVAGTPVTLEQRTEYPFGEAIEFVVRTAVPVPFSFYLRIPGWSTRATVAVNGTLLNGSRVPGTFEKIQRTFSDGDVVTLHVPMSVTLTNRQSNSVTVDRGPLLYALHIAENAQPQQGYATTADFPAWEITPGSAWNYGLSLSGSNPASQFTVTSRVSAFPWETGKSPVELRGPGLSVTGWTLPSTDNPKLPTNPAFNGSTQQLRLVPFGSTRIRLAVFPAKRTQTS